MRLCDSGAMSHQKPESVGWDSWNRDHVGLGLRACPRLFNCFMMASERELIEVCEIVNKMSGMLYPLPLSFREIKVLWVTRRDAL